VEKPIVTNRKWIGRCLILLDFIAILAAFFGAYWILIRTGWIQYELTPFKDYATLCVLSIPLILLICRGVGLYDYHELSHGTNDSIKIVKACTILILSLIVLNFWINHVPQSRAWLLAAWILTIFAMSLGRFVCRRLIKVKGWGPMERVLVLGANEEAKIIAERLKKSRMGEVIGFLDEFSPQNEEVWDGKRVLGPPSQYVEIAKKHGVQLVVLVPEAIGWETQREILRQAAGQKYIEVQIAPGFNELYSVSMRVSFRGNVPLLQFRPGYANGLDAALKKAMDYTLGVLILLLIAPVILALGLLLWIQGKSSVIEGFEVLGRHGRVFRALKFRSNLVGATGYRSFRRQSKPAPHKEELNRLGEFLFRTTLDKLPQLFNVLTGKMSLVGPRVVPVEAAKQYGPWLPSILTVKPGMTGTWALREAQNLEQEISLTLYYMRNWSIGQDLAILAQTAVEMIRTRFRTRPLPSAEQEDLAPEVRTQLRTSTGDEDQDLKGVVKIG